MKQSRVLEVKVMKCPLTEDTGFKIKGMRNNTYVGTSGIMVAHDLIEHMNELEDIGSIGDELMALGGIWACRGQWGDINRNSQGSSLTPQQQVAGEIPDLYYRFKKGIPFEMDVPNRIGGLEAEENYELWFDSLAEEALKMTRGEWTQDGAWDSTSWGMFIEAGGHFFVNGMRLFSEIWDSNDLLANTQFWVIQEEVEDALKRYKTHIGRPFVLAYGGGCCSIVPKEDDDLL